MPKIGLPSSSLPVAAQTLDAATYFYPISQGTNGTSATLGNGNLRVAPFVAPASVTLVRLGIGVTAAGDAASVFRLGIYKDNAGKPGALLVDGGTVACSAIATVEATVSVALTAGALYWIGGALQSTTTQPTLEVGSSSGNTGAAAWMAIGTTKPVAAQSSVGYLMSAVTGALPGTFSGFATSGSVPRLFVRTA